jgi:hypothetical protein
LADHRILDSTTLPPILLIASRHDPVARDFAASAGEVLLMTAADLSGGGWCYRPGEAGRSTLRVGGVDLAAGDLGGVVTRLPWITEEELPHIHAEDQSYVAAEMNALLVAWLNELPCPVLNRPGPSSLTGLAWRREQWIGLALGLGIPVAEVVESCVFPRGDGFGSAAPRQGVDGWPGTGAESAPRGSTAFAGTADASTSRESPRTAVTVVSGQAPAAADRELVSHACRLAEAAGMDCLTAEFSGQGREARFVGADPLPDLADARVTERILAWFGRRRSAP